MKPLMVGLTGNIGCGKSTVAKMLATYRDVEVFDTDKIWKVVMNTVPVRGFIIDLIGSHVFRAGAWDYETLARELFRDTKKRVRLEDFGYPFVMEEIRAQSSLPICVVESAILFEKGWDKDFVHTIVVTCDLIEQERRVLARVIPGRPSLSREQFFVRLAACMTQEEKTRRASFTIETSGTLLELEGRVHKLYDQLRGQAGEYHEKSSGDLRGII